MLKVIALDIETKNLDMETEGLEFSNPKGWKTSCVSIYDCTGGGYFYNYADLEELPYEIIEDYGVLPFEALKNDMNQWYEEGYLLLTKNGNNFDLPIISKPISEGGCGVAAEVEKFNEGDGITSSHLDLQTYLEEATNGVRFSLQTLIKSVLGEQESKLMEAKFAPDEWAAGNYGEVLRYCEEDARYTYKVWEIARMTGSIQASGKTPEGNYENCYVRIRW